jgi:tetraacyldisaccharide-1-P 4'-kinase
MKKDAPQKEEMKAGDPVFDRIYQKVITSDCYEHSYTRLTDLDIHTSELIVFITSKDNPKCPPAYLYTKTNSVVVWKVSNIDKLTDNKYNLLESLIRRMAKPKD